MKLVRFASSNVSKLALSACLTLSPFAIGVGHAQPVGIPSMGKASAVELSPVVERLLGDAIMEQGRREPTYVNDPDVNQYLTELGRQLAAHGSGTPQAVSVFAVRDTRINAFALPGGYIGINSGLITTAETESELASVVAHEISHVLQRHVARGMTQQSRTNHLMLASLAGALLAGLSGQAEIAMGVASFGQAAAVDQKLGFSRQAEQEADRVGYEMMRKAGFDLSGMVEMFHRLSNSARLNEGVGGGVYATTHPLSLQRMSDIQNRVRNASPTPRVDSDAFWFVRSKLRVIQARQGQPLRNTISRLEEDAKSGQGIRAAAAWYGLAYSALQAKNLAKAESAIQKARQMHGQAPQIEALAAWIAIERGQIDQALNLSKEAVQKWPSNQSVSRSLTRALQQSNQHQAAVQALTQHIKKWPDVPKLHQLMAQSYDQLGKPVQARQSMATYYEQIGAYPTAVDQLQQARAMSKDFYEQSQLDVRIRSIKEQLRTSRQMLEKFKSGNQLKSQYLSQYFGGGASRDTAHGSVALTAANNIAINARYRW